MLAYVEIKKKKLYFRDFESKCAIDIESSFIVFKECLCCALFKCTRFERNLVCFIGIALALLHLFGGLYYEPLIIQKICSFFGYDGFDGILQIEIAGLWIACCGVIFSVIFLFVRE